MIKVDNSHKFIVFVENPFEKALFDALYQDSYNFEKYVQSLSRKKQPMQLTTDFLHIDFNLDSMFFLNLHKIDVKEIGNIVGKEIPVMKTLSVKPQKTFQSRDAKLYRQPFSDINFFDYQFQLEQFYNKSLQEKILEIYESDFQLLEKYKVFYEPPVEETKLTNVKKNETQDPFFKAKTEMQRINNKVGYCHLYDDYYMFINEEGYANITKNHHHSSSLVHENEFVDRNFNYLV
jgi:hypothetical protein